MTINCIAIASFWHDLAALINILWRTPKIICISFKKRRSKTLNMVPIFMTALTVFEKKVTSYKTKGVLKERRCTIVPLVVVTLQGFKCFLQQKASFETVVFVSKCELKSTCTKRWDGVRSIGISKYVISCFAASSRKSLCSTGTFECQRILECIDEDRKCDGVPDCRDMTDEKYCKLHHQAADWFRRHYVSLTITKRRDNLELRIMWMIMTYYTYQDKIKLFC